jgi:hypothetical protein
MRRRNPIHGHNVTWNLVQNEYVGRGKKTGDYYTIKVEVVRKRPIFWLYVDNEKLEFSTTPEDLFSQADDIENAQLQEVRTANPVLSDGTQSLIGICITVGVFGTLLYFLSKASSPDNKDVAI